MPIPAYCDEPQVTCCEGWFNTVEAITQKAYGAVEDCLGERCKEFSTWVSHGVPLYVGDYVVGWLDEIAPRPEQAERKLLAAPRQRLTVGVALCQEGYPGLQMVGKEPVLPKPEELNQATYHSYGVAESLHRGVLRAIVRGEINGCSLATFSRGGPQLPEMYGARWLFRYVVNVGTG